MTKETLEFFEELVNPAGRLDFPRDFPREEALALAIILDGQVTIRQPEPGKYKLVATMDGFLKSLYRGNPDFSQATNLREMHTHVDLRVFRSALAGYLDRLWLEVGEHHKHVQRMRSSLGV
jgi:hypothetical protein